MDFGKLPDFCREVCSIDEMDGDEPRSIYIRIRAGASARAARQQWRQNLEEKDWRTLNTAIREALFKMAESEYTLFMIEAVYRGESGPFNSVTLRKEASEVDEYNSREVAGLLAKEMVAQSKVLRSQNEDLVSFASGILDRNTELTHKVAELTAQNQVLGYVIEAEQYKEQDTAMKQALNMFVPMIPVVLEKLSGGKQQQAIPQGEQTPQGQPSAEEIDWPEGDANTAKIGPNGETPAQLADQMLQSLDVLVHQYPELITEERQTIIAGWFQLMMQQS